LALYRTDRGLVLRSTYGCITLTASASVRSQKLSDVELGYYLDG